MTMRTDARSTTGAIGMGLVLGFMLVAFLLSFSALVYSAAPAHLATGATLILTAGAFHSLIAARFSSLTGAVSIPQDAPTAILAASLAGVLAGVAPEASFGTVIAYAALCGGLTGLMMIVLGGFRLGRLARFVPIPVIGGFLAGTGWLLITGGIGLVSAGHDWNTWTVGATVGAVGFALWLLWRLRRGPGVLLFPSAVLFAVAAFFVVLWVGGVDISQARQLGLLPDLIDSGRGSSLSGFDGVDWPAIGSGLGGILTVPVVATMALLLNVSALDLVRGADADLDRELRVTGGVNLLVAVTGAPAGYHALGPSALAFRAGIASPLVPAIVAGVCLLVAFGGSGLIGLVPLPVIGSLLVMLGLGFISDWLIDYRKGMTRPEYVVMVATVVLVATLGLLVAVLWGMIASVLLFVAAYSRLDPVRNLATGSTRRSTVDRTHAAATRLAREGNRILVVELQGFLFFGTADAAVNKVQPLVGEDVDWLILDLAHVDGMDATARLAIGRLGRHLVEHGCRLIVTARPAGVAAIDLPQVDVTEAPDLDHGLELAEDGLLGDLASETAEAPDLFAAFGWERLQPFLTVMELAANTTVIEAGAEDRAILFVADGWVVTELETPRGWRRVRSSGPGTVIGEMSLYRAGGRSARVRTVAPTTIYRLDAGGVSELERTDPEAAVALHRALAALMADRLDVTNKALSHFSG